MYLVACLSVCLWTLSRKLTYDLDPGWPGIVGTKHVLTSLFVTIYPALRSRSKVKIKCLAHSGRYKGLGLPSAVKGNYPKVLSKENHYQSIDFVCVSVILRLQ